MITNKVKSLLALNGKTLTDYALVLNKTKQSLNKKVQAETYTASDLIKLCGSLGYSLVVVDVKGKPVITFDMDDIPKKTNK